jgi:hypothetical protein
MQLCGNGGKMKRWTHEVSGMYHDPGGEWVAIEDVPKLDKPAALMALIDYSELTGNGRADAAIHKLAAAIIAEVEALK